MYVCVCNAVTDQTVREAAASGVRSVSELTMRTGCGACCGSCVPLAERLLQEGRGCCGSMATEAPSTIAIAA